MRVDDPLEITEDATWRRAVEYVQRASIQFESTRHAALPTPTFSEDGDGGVDLVWRVEGRSLYLSIPNEPHNVVTFYGRDRENPESILRGEIDGERDGGWLLEWVADG
jgi:hypothetical protein